ncbi:hypothetical protein C8Q80DRAFT_1169835 [Daedaleopsis nitida]|nr:hypothetical protein C8Q80DRAFT_1169835 [Daedaleopsis nitida]
MPSSNQTCAACRERKVRCDGNLPTCGPCTKARKPRECTYTVATAIAATPKGEYLKKGAACAPCRRKKKKCDANRPYCSTCQTAGKERECAYDDNPESTLTEALVKVQSLEQRLAMYERSRSSSVTIGTHHGSPTIGTDALMSPIEPVASTSRTFVPSWADLPTYNFLQAYNVVTAFNRMYPQSPTTDLQYISPPQPLEGLREFRGTFAAHAAQYGCLLSWDKMQAIIAGDISGKVVHPAFTYIAQLHGCYLWQHERHMTNLYPDVEDEQLQYLLGSLDDINPVSELQIRYILACYFLVKQQMDYGEQQLVIAADLVRRHRLAYPAKVEPLAFLQDLPEATEDETELITALSHMLYLDRVSSFIFHVNTRMDRSFNEAFKDVAIYFPNLAKTNLVYLRTRSLLLYIRASEVVLQWQHLSESTGPFQPARAHLMDLYWPLIDEFADHLSKLRPVMLKASFNMERENTVALKFCLVVSLSGLAQLHWLLHRTHAESRQSAIDVVMEVVGITRSFKDTDYILLDPLLGLAWAEVAKILWHAMTGGAPPNSDIEWRSAMQSINTGAHKLHHEIPYAANALQVISELTNCTSPVSPVA